MYAAHYPDKIHFAKGGKVSIVCKQVREELEKQDQSELKVASLLPVLGTLVREGGNGMEEALARIRTVRGRTVKIRIFQRISISLLQNIHLILLKLKLLLYPGF